MSSHSTIDISLLGREYRVACAPEERDSLLAAVAHVEAKMNDIATRTKGGGERLAVMTALNLAHELLSRDKALAAAKVDSGVGSPEMSAGLAENGSVSFDSPGIVRRIDAMVARLDAVLNQQESLL
ncbi:conserved protein of unknown function [Sterolibacterium denitrificans]|uniref:Uncharacterized protein n=2 Tax=Sterolibacterium denitrificans TaxID=157592 RepID=A0A7Z7HQE8_9PROT|nr:cell division protein ZapA [Sterolibacterium denitrificans]KYC28883.1 hypothetical protein ACY05_04030 [Sterolibacterium denitrificans]SMB21159.1 conserved protein of unknown function [Sterolibacterium denitrificans]